MNQDIPLSPTNDDHPSLSYVHPYLVLVGVRGFRMYTYHTVTGVWKLRCNDRGTASAMCGNTGRHSASATTQSVVYKGVLYAMGPKRLMALNLAGLHPDATGQLAWTAGAPVPSEAGYRAKCDFSLVLYGQRLFLFGGSAYCNFEDDENERFNHLWAYDLGPEPQVPGMTC